MLFLLTKRNGMKIGKHLTEVRKKETTSKTRMSKELIR